MIELHGILSAVIHFEWEIDIVNDLVTVITDSSSVEKLCKRCLNGLELASDKKINERLMKLMVYNIRIIYKSCRSADIDLADLMGCTRFVSKP